LEGQKTVNQAKVKASLPEYWDNNGSNIVACVVSYEKITKLQNGEAASIFTTDIDEEYLDFDGVVFQIVAPKKYRGKFLRIKNIKDYDALDGWKPPVYKIGTFFYFDRNQDAEGFTLEDYFFELVKDWARPRFKYIIPFPPNTGSTPGDRYYLTDDEAKQDALKYIEDWLPYLMDVEKYFNITIETLEKNTQRSDEDERIYRQAKRRNREIKGCITRYKHELQKIKRQLEGLKTLNQRKESVVNVLDNSGEEAF
jgi:hypothetical protein